MIFNDSILKIEVPSEWLQAITAVIFKKGKKSLVSSYKPVSLTCILCKCLEEVIRNHITKHMKKQTVQQAPIWIPCW